MEVNATLILSHITSDCLEAENAKNHSAQFYKSFEVTDMLDTPSNIVGVSSN